MKTFREIVQKGIKVTQKVFYNPKTKPEVMSQIEKSTKIKERILENGKKEIEYKFNVGNKKITSKVILHDNEEIAKLQKMLIEPKTVYETFNGSWEENEKLANSFNENQIEKYFEESNDNMLLGQVEFTAHAIQFFLKREQLLIGVGLGHWALIVKKGDTIFTKIFTTTNTGGLKLVSTIDFTGNLTNQYIRNEIYINLHKFLVLRFKKTSAELNFEKENRQAIIELMNDPDFFKNSQDFFDVLEKDMQVIKDRVQNFGTRKANLAQKRNSIKENKHENSLNDLNKSEGQKIVDKIEVESGKKNEILKDFFNKITND